MSLELCPCIMCPSLDVPRSKGPPNSVTRQSGRFAPAFVCALCISKSKTYEALVTGGILIRTLSSATDEGKVKVIASHQDIYVEATGASMAEAFQGTCEGLDVAYKLAPPPPRQLPMPATIPTQLLTAPTPPKPITCVQKLQGPGAELCGAEASHFIMWPGSTAPVACCRPHFDKAKSIASTMGFVLESKAIGV